MAEEAVAGVGPNGPPQTQRRRRRRLLLLLLLRPRRRWGTYGGGCFRSLRGLSASPAGFQGLPPSSSVGLGGLSRASPLLFLFLLPCPRLAAAATPRRHLGDWESSRPGPRETAGSRSRSRADELERAPPRLQPPAAAAVLGRPPAGTGLRGGGGQSRWCKSCLVPSVVGPLHPCSFPALAPARRDLSISTRSQQEAKKLPLFTSSGSKKLYFDTHAVVLLLEEKGFTTQQAEIIVSSLVKIMNNNMEVVSQDMVTKVHQEITVQQIMSQIAGVKKDMIILEKSEFSTLRAENEKLTLELHQLKQRMLDEILKVRADNKLDFNLEKSRVKELYALNERKLLEMRSEVLTLQAQQLRALTQTDRKIDTEVAGLKTMLESHKLDNIKYLAGSIFTCLTVALGFYRLWI
ncbi:mitochondrial calcium uniporter regulator 1 [Phascolarctos cinereus]|uniref:Mitochondrial calcium uniporter regulator 1 n=1 Tax=Phascolarctos cinereus TaxID=38626 RepID=A0A6P5KAF6_PHACI|nr:mitochondrial calcium uniporter regulator 1 [Phascolarctos cinereus]XP_020842441.1 mitochondrial calcium uniporter regulator 1 [Phascolarctos cinereus]